MDKQIRCESCGNDNSESNKFCSDCGNRLTKNESILPQESNNFNNDFKDIKNLLNDLLKFGGFITIVQDEFYVQFLNEKRNNIIFEAVSRTHLEKVGYKEAEFNGLGFTYQISGNFGKTIKVDEVNVDELLLEIQNVFLTIYKVQLTNYYIRFEIHYPSESSKANNQTNLKKRNNSKSSNNYAYIIGIVVAIIIAYYASSNDSDRDNQSNREVVFNSNYDASVFQVEKYLKKEYLKDPDSYQGISWSSVQIDRNNSQYKYFVRHKFRAKNSFGGYVIEEMIFYLNSEGYVVSTTDL